MNTRDLWAYRSDRSMGLSTPRVLAIINTTPDSFSDGGLALDPCAAAERAAEAIGGGAVGVDVGGESTRPGAGAVPDHEQIRRAVPAIRAIRAAIGPGPLITIDTTLASVAEAALGAGADAVNDVSAGEDDPAMLPLVARAGCGIILMHRLLPPSADRFSDRYDQPPRYDNVVERVRAYLAARLEACGRAGIPVERTLLDPGLGFGKTVEQNLALIRGTGRLLDLGRPVLSGLSRKSFVARAAGMGPDTSPRDRIAGTLGLTMAHIGAGARLCRVHDAASAAALIGAARPA